MDIVILIISIVCILVGLILIVINLPGIFLVWAGILAHAWYNGFTEVPIWVIVVMFIFALVSTIVDNLAIGFSSDRFGASKYGVIGALVGGFIGAIVGNIIGLLIGPFLGAMLAEIIFAGKDFVTSAKAGFGAFLGFFLGIFMKFGIALFMVIVWVVMIWK